MNTEHNICNFSSSQTFPIYFRDQAMNFILISLHLQETLALHRQHKIIHEGEKG